VEIEIDNAEDEEEALNHWIDELGNRPILRGATTLCSENLNPVQVTDREREQIQPAAGLRKKLKTVVNEQTDPVARVMMKRARLKTGRDKNELPARLTIENLV
jgi:hypothetical protein